MKRFILCAVMMLTMIITANAQEFTGNIGATAGIEFHNQYLTSYPATFNMGIGAIWDDGIYVGVGLAPGVHSEYMHADGWSETHNSFIMPYYAQVSYIRPEHWYGDVKIGAELVATDGQSENFFFMSVTPLGYTFDEHSSLGLGWRYHARRDFKGHALVLTYQYTF